MKEYKFKKIDAFATYNSSGNPAGYIWLDSETDITSDEMQQIAKELKGYVNEVGYVHRLGKDKFSLKYYSSEREVEFCGHATIAIMYDLVVNNTDLQNLAMLEIQTNKGWLPVFNSVQGDNSVFIMSPEPQFFDCKLNPKEVAEELNIDITDISKEHKLSIIDAGLKTLLVPIDRLEAILKISPQLTDLKRFCEKNGIDIIEVFTNDVANSANDFRTRVFAPTFGYLEDPATGSGNSAFGNYLIKNSLWVGNDLRIEQNGFKDNFNLVNLKKTKDENGNWRVLFGGGAITRLHGVYHLY